MDDNDRMWMLITIKDTREQLDRLWRMVCGDRGPNEIYKSVMDSTVETKGRSRWGKVSFNAGARSSIVEEQKPLEDDPDTTNQLNTEMDSAVEDGSEEIDKYRRRMQG
jgi:hypothetical protein